MHRGHTKCYGWRADYRGDDLEGLGKTAGRPELWSNFVSISGNICDLATARSRPAMTLTTSCIMLLCERTY